MDTHLNKVSPAPHATHRHGVVYHYYGDVVRRLFLAGGVVILSTLPFVWSISPILTLLGALIVVGLVFQAGVTTPSKEWTAYANTIISGIALVVFEYSAIFNYIRYDRGGAYVALFYFAQALAVIFFFAMYFASKTMRAMILNEQVTKQEIVEAEDRDPL
jgi:Zn-dependent protease with chaperone function